MALEDDIKNGKIEAEEFNQVIMELDSTLKSLAVTFQETITQQTQNATIEAKKLAASYGKDITSGLGKARTGLEELQKARETLNNGQALTVKQLNAIKNAESDQANTVRIINQAKQEGINLNAEELLQLEENFQKQNNIQKSLKKRAEAQEESLAVVGKLSGAFTGLLDKLGMGDLNKFFNLEKANEQSKVQLENLGKSGTAGQVLLLETCLKI